MSVLFSQFVAAELVLPGDLMGDNDATRTLVGELASALLGADNFLPNNTGTFLPLQIALASSGLSFIIGAPGQGVVLNRRVVDVCPAQSISIAPNTSGSTRVDLVSLAYQQTQVNAASRQTASGGTTTVYQLQESLQYAYAAGASNPNSGFTAFATITVPNGATNASQCTVQYLFPTVTQALLTAIGSIVSSLNGASGALALAQGAGITISTAGGVITISSTVSGGIPSVNGQTGPIVIAQGAGITVSVSGGTITIASTTPTPVSSLNGGTGPLAITAGNSGIGVSGPSGGNIAVSNLGVTSVNGNTGVVATIGQVGSVAVASARITSSSSPVTVNVPYQLASGSWQLTAEAYCDLGSGHTMTLTGSGSASSWESPSTVSDQPGIERVQLRGTSSGGDTPSVTLTFPNGAPNGAYLGLVIIQAVRTA